MTLSRVCFLCVTDVLEGTSEIDWLKNPIGCSRRGAGGRKEKRINCSSLSLPALCDVCVNTGEKKKKEIPAKETDNACSAILIVVICLITNGFN
jgi:hypothetical protein